MSRSIWIKAHLFAAAFFSPPLLIMAVSGGLYLVGIKGEVTRTPTQLPADTRIDLQAPDIETTVRQLLTQIDPEYQFEYIKAGGSSLITRPTSRDYYEFKANNDGLTLTRVAPDFQKRLVELHKGHGPGLFKDFQKVMAIALLFVLLSGAWLGLSSAGLRISTLATVGAGLGIMLLLITVA